MMDTYTAAVLRALESIGAEVTILPGEVHEVTAGHRTGTRATAIASWLANERAGWPDYRRAA